MENSNRIDVYRLGLQPYGKVLELQRWLQAEIIVGKREGALLLLRHHPVFTVGRAGNSSGIFAHPSSPVKNEVPVFDVERGGDVTFHGPGQLIAYPLLRLQREKQDLQKLVFNLEEAARQMLESYGITAERRKDYPGLWLELRKIASVGLSVKRWVTCHGIAINIREEGQEYFQYINPCGLVGIQVTSLEKETGVSPPWHELENRFTLFFSELMGVEPRDSSAETLWRNYFEAQGSEKQDQRR